MNRDDFEHLHGSRLLMMALETYNSSIYHHVVDGTKDKFILLQLDSFSGEKISNFTTESQRLIKIDDQVYRQVQVLSYVPGEKEYQVSTLKEDRCISL
jgi:hypothetical protein